MQRALITGGGGFVGKAIVTSLRNRGVDCEVIGRNHYPELADKGVRCHQGDISDKDFILRTIKDYDVVFHVAAFAGIWGSKQHYYNANVIGTQNVIDGCLVNGITALVHTSTPSVVFNQTDIISGDESLDYPSKFLCSYAETKAIAEKAVLEVDQSKLKTCCIRPHLIWGPEDPHLIPRLIERGKSGKLKIVGDGMNKVDISYIDNVAHAHILAAEELFKKAKCAGKAYFIGQEEPVEIWNWINQLFERVGVEKITKKVPFWVAYSVGGLLETLYYTLRISKEPGMTRFLAEQLAKSHYFSHENAQKDFNYNPVISTEEGMDRLIFWLNNNEDTF